MAIAHFWSFDAQCLGLAIDALGRGALIVDGMVQRSVAIKRHAHLATQFPVDIFDTAFALEKLRMGAALAGFLRKEQRTAEALGEIAPRVAELEVRCHRQLLRTQRGAVSQPFVERMGMLIEGNGPDAALHARSLVHIPRIEGRIRRDIDGIGSPRPARCGHREGENR